MKLEQHLKSAIMYLPQQLSYSVRAL